MATNPVTYLENSFLKPILEKEGLTDVSYNGSKLYFVTNSKGREESDISLTNEEIGSFLRQIANVTERQFSYLNPILDVSFGTYRLNAVNNSLARIANEKPILSPFVLKEKGAKLMRILLFWMKKVGLLFKTSSIERNPSLLEE